MGKHDRRIDKLVECPFYNWSSPYRICCEGTYKSNTVNLIFADEKEAHSYMHTFCCDLEKCARCMVSQMLTKKYE